MVGNDKFLTRRTLCCLYDNSVTSLNLLEAGLQQGNDGMAPPRGAGNMTAVNCGVR
ncbi:hypothetical protein CBM2626_A140151 [Cupriavidus taiwanensis]|uniref:Uncharacterized protein n=1 Tax=Cupriavidus taiwanensis TaxID=164546 RepID=A0A976AVI5_9BURK|nr:hypothetical protein CBM2614_A210380 [Cupriavidus taiwanensis]SOZ56655.1 hypothetical protein CBM2613_A220374 [Cupriavidus taiwanensis]SOZ98054.1 hypothetical protein CBM2626_A140151 [Cupriavidus taiwanensis]SPA04935.1 hypothetical protein CBM2625_A170372 [Cupriavidus taiwanensis]